MGQEPPARGANMDAKTENRVWRGQSDGMAVGEIRKMKGYDGYRVVTGVSAAKTRRLTSYDEDEGNGMQGSYQTTQSVTHRAATPEEGAREDARAAAAADAKRQADPNHRLAEWQVANPGATHLPELGPEAKAIDALALTWTSVASDVKVVGGARMGQTLQTASGPDGRAYARMVGDSPDGSRTTHYAVRTADAASAASAQKRQKLYAAYATQGGYGGVLRAVSPYGEHREHKEMPGALSGDEERQLAEGDRVTHMRAAATAATHRAEQAYAEAEAGTGLGMVSADDVASIHAWSAHAAKSGMYLGAHSFPRDGTSSRNDAHRRVVMAPPGGLEFGSDADMRVMEPGVRGVPTRPRPSLPTQQWDLLNSIERRAPHLGARVAAARTLLTSMYAPSGTDRAKLARTVAEPNAPHPYDVAMFRRHVTPHDVGKLPKKVQAALRAHGLTT